MLSGTWGAGPGVGMMDALRSSGDIMRRVAYLFAILSVLRLSVSLPAKAQEDATIKVESRLVLVDLTVLDDDGNPVTDLRKDEVEVSEDGRRVKISFFERRQATGQPPERTSETTGTFAPRETAEPGVLLIFLIDLPSMTPSELPRVKQAVEAFVRSQRRPEDSLMLAATGTTLLQPPTRNGEEFLKTLSRLSATEDNSSHLVRFGEDLERLLAIAHASSMRPQDLTRQAIDLGRRYIVQEEEQTRNATQSMISLIDQISTLPGRKNILYFSGGYRCNIGMAIQDILLRVLPDVHLPGLDSTHVWIRSLLGGSRSAERLNSLVRSMVEEANRSHVSFYTADGRGLVTRQDARFTALAPYSDQLVRDDINQSQYFLRDIASGTGGRSFLNSNDLQAGIRGAYREASEHYELGYVPPDGSRSGSIHEIALKVHRPKVKVRYRRSYFEPIPYDPKRRVIENAFKFPELFQDFPFEADTGVQNGELKVTVYIPTRALFLTHRDSRHQGEIAVRMALFESSGELYEGKMLFSKTYRIDFSEAEFAGLANIDNLTTTYQGHVEPGDYRLRIVVRQSEASKTATLEKRITLPSSLRQEE